MEKVFLANGGVGGRGGGGGVKQSRPRKSELLFSTSNVFTSQRHKRSATRLSHTARSNAQSCRSNSGVSITRPLRSLPTARKKGGESRLLRTLRRHRCAGAAPPQQLDSANGECRKNSKSITTSGLSWGNEFFLSGDMTMPMASATEIETQTKSTLTMQSMEFNNALDMMLRSGVQSGPLRFLHNEGAGEGEDYDVDHMYPNNNSDNYANGTSNNVGEKKCDNKEQAFSNTPSECSSFNSSITCTPFSKKGGSMKKSTNDEAGQHCVNGSAGHSVPDVDDTVQSAQQNEEAEGKGFQQHHSMVSEWNRDALFIGNQDGKLGFESFLELTSKTLYELDSMSINHHHELFDGGYSLKGRLRKKWKEQQSLPLFVQVESRCQAPSAKCAGTEDISDFLCRSLSLYNAFFLDVKSKRWLVDDNVLARCLDYVGLIGYQRLLPQHLQMLQDMVSKQTLGIVSSPIVSAPPTARRYLHGAALSNWELSGGKPYSALAHMGTSSLFLSRQEAERWLYEQEYVIGAILSCCAWADLDNFRDTTNKVPYLSSTVHPIRNTALFAMGHFAHCGGAVEFVEAWERQIGIVLGTAAPLHQRLFRFLEEGLVFTSDMEGGNLARVERTKNMTFQPVYNLWLEPEFNCEQRLWFRFAVAGVRPNCALWLRIVNIQPNTKLYMRNGMRPVWRAGNSLQQWVPVGQCSYRTINNDADGELTFLLVPRSTDIIHVAFCVPYTYADLLCHLANWHYLVKRNFGDILFEERILCRTQDGRKLHLLIITGSSRKSVGARKSHRASDVSVSQRSSTASPFSHFDSGKKVVLISGRVHPGEVTASHGIHGIITFLLSRNSHASLLREHFVFYIVPMLNPDGVARGHSRLDQNGFNLNRCYKNPIPHKQPTVNALRKLFDDLQQQFTNQFFMYLDFHSHASQSSGFMFGNCLPFPAQYSNLVFPKIVSLHAKDVFSYDICRFGKNHMTSKEGSSRVLFGGTLIHSYTVELTHFTNNKLFVDGSCCDVGNINCGSSPNNNGFPAGRFTALGNDSDWCETRHTRVHGRRQGESGGTGGGLLRGERVILSPTSHPRSARTTKSTFFSRKNKSNNKNTTSGGGCSAKRCAGNTRGGTKGGCTIACGGNVFGSENNNAGADSLLRIETACILLQSAEVGRACLLALLDYCAVKNYISPQFAQYGGMERALREVKRSAGIVPPPTKPSVARTQASFK